MMTARERQVFTVKRRYRLMDDRAVGRIAAVASAAAAAVGLLALGWQFGTITTARAYSDEVGSAARFQAERDAVIAECEKKVRNLTRI